MPILSQVQTCLLRDYIVLLYFSLHEYCSCDQYVLVHYVCGYELSFKVSHVIYSGTSDKGPSEIGTTSLQRTLVSTPC